MTNKTSEQLTSLEVLCEVILSEWSAEGRESFHIEALRTEMKRHYANKGLEVPTEIQHANRLVPTRRLLEARTDVVRPLGAAAITWRFIR